MVRLRDGGVGAVRHAGRPASGLIIRSSEAGTTAALALAWGRVGEVAAVGTGAMSRRAVRPRTHGAMPVTIVLLPRRIGEAARLPGEEAVTVATFVSRPPLHRLRPFRLLLYLLLPHCWLPPHLRRCGAHQTRPLQASARRRRTPRSRPPCRGRFSGRAAAWLLRPARGDVAREALPRPPLRRQ